METTTYEDQFKALIDEAILQHTKPVARKIIFTEILPSAKILEDVLCVGVLRQYAIKCLERGGRQVV